ncbi:MAG: tetratricopeptide repeat protein [Gemmatimonadales bacterium]
MTDRVLLEADQRGCKGAIVKIVSCVLFVAGLVALALPSQAAAQDDACHSLRYRGNFRLNGAQQHLSLAEGSSYADTKRRMANDALRTLNDALQAGEAGGADPFSTWFFFGRAYLLLGDLAGADSSFTRAATLAATDQSCTDEIKRLRKNVWIPIQQLAVGQLQSQSYDSALTLLRRGNLIYRDDPSGYMNMAVAFLNLQKDDSAVAVFRLAAHAGSDPARADVRASALINAARLELKNTHLTAAESLYREYSAMRPRDMAARSALATVLSLQNRSADAVAVYDSILANADSLDGFQLFDTGVSLFNLAVADTVRTDTVQKNALFQRAALAFEGSLRKNVAFRDAAYNLANTYLAAGDVPRTLDATKRLLALDSLSRHSWQLLAAAYQNVGHTYARRDSILRSRRDSLPAAAQYNATARLYRDSTLQALMHADSLAIEVTITRFDPHDSSANIRGAVRNLKDREHAPFTLTIELLSARGEVVTSEHVDVPALNSTGSPGQAYDFNLQVNGRGITAYRTKVS